jgi:hypothetical protein
VERAALARTKQKAEQEQRTIVGGDPSALSLLPMAVSTSAPVGQTPVRPVTRTRDHLWARGGMTPEGRIFMQTHDHSDTGPDLVRFVRRLTRTMAGTLLVIWGGAPIHRYESSPIFLKPLKRADERRDGSRIV